VTATLEGQPGGELERLEVEMEMRKRL